MEKPILFSSEMVRAILEGRKTQTRRIIKERWQLCRSPEDEPEWFVEQCPYGKPGDLLWVRETWCYFPKDALDGMGENIYFRVEQKGDKFSAIMKQNDVSWRPSIFMPRWASRITLKITNVRVERIKDLTLPDMFAEGFQTFDHGFVPYWDKLNAKRGYSWNSNPWVWVIDFEKVNNNERN